MDQNILFLFIATLVVVLLFSCAKLPEDFDKPESHTFIDTEDTTLGRYVAAQKTGHEGLSGFHLLAEGLDAFVARAILSEAAERCIDAQYYLYNDDLLGRLFSYSLVRAADRGVRVRLLVDDMGLAGRDKSAVAMDSHPNIEVRIFNPFSRNVKRLPQFLTRIGSVTRRMHNKSFTVDNQVTILGGRNIGNEYFNANPDMAFEDLDVIGMGPVTHEVSTIFDKYWNSDLAYPVSALYEGEPLDSEELEAFKTNLVQLAKNQKNSQYLKALESSKLAEDIRNRSLKVHWGTSEVVYDKPEKLLHSFDDKEFHLAPMLRPYLESLENELIVFTPYFVPGEEGTAIFSQLAAKGIKVKILTNSLSSNNVGIVHAGYKKYRKELLRNGVQLFELDKNLTREERKNNKFYMSSSKSTLHAKSFVFDRKYIFVGSLNLDPRALIHNTEIGVILKVPEIAKVMGETFDNEIETAAFRLELKADDSGSEKLIWHGIKNGKPIQHTHEPYVGFWRRFFIKFLSLFPIDSQL